ncbi:MAG: glycosyltransferase family 4 protein, partial [Actinomycetota bacterium]|nr:glycosyltransferase family 4 protein [Actinomycetota bacterium]
MLDIALRFPLVATIHHPITIDARLDKQHATFRKRVTLARWYAFTRMQARVAPRMPRVITASESGRRDAIEELGVLPRRAVVVHNGVDTDLFRPVEGRTRVPGRIVTTTSADVPIKGLVYLIEAIAKLRTERDVHLVVVGSPRTNGAVARAIERFDLASHVRFETNVDSLRLVELYADAQVAVVPSLYEGFSLPAAEAMSCGVPVVATTGGALPEVVGRDGSCGLLVPPADAGALAAAVGTLLDDPALRDRMGRAGRARVEHNFTWSETARKTVEEYRTVMERC